MPTRHTLLAIVLATLLFAAAGLAARDTNAGTAAPTTTTTSSTTVAPTTTTTTVDPAAFARWIEASARTTTTTTTLAPVVAVAPPSVAPTTSGCAYEAQIRAAFPNDGDWAVSVAWRESRCQPGAVNWGESCGSGSHAHGLFQMCFPMHLPTFQAVGCTDPLNAECNIRAAAHLYAGSGRSPWRL